MKNKKRSWKAPDVFDVLTVAGFVCLVRGFYMLYRPLGWIVTGMILIFAAWVTAKTAVKK